MRKQLFIPVLILFEICLLIANELTRVELNVQLLFKAKILLYGGALLKFRDKLYQDFLIF